MLGISLFILYICIHIIFDEHEHVTVRIITEASAAKAVASASKASHAEPEPIGFIQAFMLPNVMSYAIAFGFFKLVIFIYIIVVIIYLTK